MKFVLQILFLFLTCFTNLVNATPVFTKVVLPSNAFSFSKTENVKEESTVKIGVQNFARSGIEENLFSLKSTSRESCAFNVASTALGAGAVYNAYKIGRYGLAVFELINVSLDVADLTGLNQVIPNDLKPAYNTLQVALGGYGVFAGKTPKQISNSAQKPLLTQSNVEATVALYKRLDELPNTAAGNAVRNKVTFLYEYFKAKKVLQGAGSLVTKLDNLGLTALKTEINLLDDVAKAKFLDEFAGASDDALRAMNGNTSLVNYWKANGNFIKNKTYPNVGHKAWDDTKNAIIAKADPTETKILNAIENAPPPGNKVVMAGAYSPDLPTSNVTIKYNDKNFNVSSLEPELKQHLEYLQMIKNDFYNGGKLYQKLYSNVTEFKIQNAEIAGTHAEVLATNEVIIQLKAANKFNGIQDLNKIHVLVKGRSSLGNMCRCPHCFQILDGVKMIGNQ